MYRHFTVCLAALFLALPLVQSASAQTREIRFRKIAPGILKTVAPNTREGETYTGPLMLRQLNSNVPDFTPNFAPKTETIFERTKQVTLRREIWGMEFTFKPLRMIEVDVPQTTGPNADGRFKKENVWYMVYRLRNVGGAFSPNPTDVLETGEPDPFGKFNPDKVDTLDKVMMPNRFYPIFVLEGWVQDPLSKKYIKIPYPDRVIPSAMDDIRDKEEPDVPLASELVDAEGKPNHHKDLVTPCFRDSVQFHQITLPLMTEENKNTFWGVVMWSKLDPRIDFLTINIQGLTNAFRFQQLPDGTKKYQYKTLQLNFWRPGDRHDEPDDRIRYGVPLLTNPLEQIRLFRLYNIPGPSIAVYEHVPKTRRESFLFRVDGQLDGEYRSVLRRELNAGTFSSSLNQGFTDVGITLPSPPTLQIVIDMKEWRFQADIEGVTREFRIRYEPQYWEKTEEGIEIKERVDNLWIYR